MQVPSSWIRTDAFSALAPRCTIMTSRLIYYRVALRSPTACMLILSQILYPLSHLSWPTQAAFSSRFLTHDIILFTMETERLDYVGLVWSGFV